jgi:phage replication O-like protein O
MIDTNFTKVPNFMIAKMCDMTAAELKIFLVVARKTYGYQKQADKISLSQFQELSGLSRQGVLNGIKAGMDHGWLICEDDKYIYTYWISRLSDFWGTGQRSRPQMVNEVDQLGEKLVNEVDLQKKVNKENKENNNPTIKRTKKQQYKHDIITMYGLSLRNDYQHKLADDWYKEYGPERTLEVFAYYRAKGKSLGQAMALMRKSLPNWKFDDIVETKKHNLGGGKNGYSI